MVKESLRKIVLGCALISASGLTVGCGAGMGGGRGSIRKGMPTDMSRTRYREVIEKKADDLMANPKRSSGDTINAIELYGNAGKLDKMDAAAREYFDTHPESGVRVLERAEIIRKFYSD